MIVHPVDTLDAIGRRSLARLIREGRAHRHRPPSSRRGLYLRLPPPTLLGFRQGVHTGAPREVTFEAAARKERIERAYTETGSLDVVAAILETEAISLASERAATSRDEAEARRVWTRWVVESDLALVAEAVAAGWLVYTPPPPASELVDTSAASSQAR